MGGPADHSDQSRGGEQHTDTKNTLVYIHTTDRVIDYCIVQMCPVGVEILHLHCVCYLMLSLFAVYSRIHTPGKRKRINAHLQTTVWTAPVGTRRLSATIHTTTNPTKSDDTRGQEETANSTVVS